MAGGDMPMGGSEFEVGISGMRHEADFRPQGEGGQARCAQASRDGSPRLLTLLYGVVHATYYYCVFALIYRGFFALSLSKHFGENLSNARRSREYL